METTVTGTVLGKRYVLGDRLGHGGMGSVWRAADMKLKRAVALKLLSRKHLGDTEVRARFEREAFSIASIRSQNIVQVYDYDLSARRPYIVMELLEGEKLSSFMKREGKLSLEVATRIADQVGKALSTAHKAGVVHRDLKPGNIILVEEHGELIAKVYDFGIAKEVVTEAEAKKKLRLTKVGTIMGTPPYMSPEQITGGEVDGRTDMWALGVILYAMVCGHRPFMGDGILDLAAAIMQDEPPSIRLAREDVPVEVDAFFRRALAKEPDERFDDALDMTQEFAAIAGLQRSSESLIVGRVSAASVADDVMDSQAPPSSDATSGGAIGDEVTGETTIAEATALPIRSALPSGVRGWMVAGGVCALLSGGMVAYTLTDGGGSRPAADERLAASANAASDLGPAGSASVTSAPSSTAVGAGDTTSSARPAPTSSASTQASSTRPPAVHRPNAAPHMPPQPVAPRPQPAAPPPPKPVKPKPGMFDEPW